MEEELETPSYGNRRSDINSPGRLQFNDYGEFMGVTD